MGFSWWCEDKNGHDLFDEYGVHFQALNLGPNGRDDTEAEFRVSDFRQAWGSVPYKDKLDDAAKDAVARVQSMARANLCSATESHCRTCSCPRPTIVGWSEEALEALLSVPLERVWRAGGGW